MRHICAYCNKNLSPPDGDDDKISHGVCTSCYNHVKATMGVDLREFLNMLDHPVLLVDHDVRVLTSNWKARQMAGKVIRDVEGHLGGEVFECENATLPDGCGKTIHCSACVIRNAVNEVYQSGNSVENRPATLHQGIPGRARTVDLLVSAKKSEDVVLLMLEPSPEAGQSTS